VSALDVVRARLDGAGMLARIAAQADDVERALERLGAEPWPALEAPDLIAVGALGGSAIGADLTAGLYADQMPRPLLTVREYHWPACVRGHALAVLSSYSGNTEETLALYREAGTRGVGRVALTTGGTLGAWCARDRVPMAKLPGGSPPRAALFSSWVPLTGLLARLGWVSDPTADWREAAGVLRRGARRFGPDADDEANEALALARAVQGRMVFLYAGSERLGAVVTRVRNQLNENAKLLGHSAVVPELNHNEIVGWERPGPVHGAASLIVLRDREDSPEVAKRLTLTAEYAGEHGAAVHEWTSQGTSRLARLASLIQFGDYLSFWLAMLNGVDPTPIASIDSFKRRLATP
jgi:glucose/mannose-6-phosphate isomerase